jgi:DNA-binding response OmpR family regulator
VRQISISYANAFINIIIEENTAMKPIRILIVDRALQMREIMRYALENSFPKIVIDEAASNSEAKSKLENRYYDLIICDWEAQKIQGPELLEWMREVPALNTIPFIMLTSRSDKPHIINALQSGVNSYLIKPFSVVGLIHGVMSVITKLDRREFERFFSDSPVSLTFQKNKIKGRLIDISAGGLLATFKRRGSFANILEKVSIDIEPDSKTNIPSIQGFVVRIEAAEKSADSGYINIAVKFLKISSDTRNELNNFLSSLKK